MTRRSKVWAAAAAVYTFINAAGAVYAAALDEGVHALVHVGLLLLGVVGYLGWRLRSLERRHELPGGQPADARIDYLQQSVDAIALEVERIGEAQRFSDRLRVERGEKSPLKEGQ